MKKFLVIGNPIEHSLSPDLHNFWIKKNNIKATYEKKLIKSENLPEIIGMLKNNTLNGINVTVPFKSEVIKFLDELSEEAKLTKSVNTIYILENKVIGHNTDIGGFELAIRHCKFDINKKKIIILGAGGVVSSIIVALKKMGVEKIFLTNRTYENAEKIKKNYPDIDLIEWGKIIEVDMIINATSVGLKNNENIDLDVKKFGTNKFFYDVIYNPKMTNFLKRAKENNNRIENGKMMFIYQAHQAFAVWHKIFPEISEEVTNLIEK